MEFHVTPYLRVARPTIGVDPLDYSAQPTLIAPHTISFCDSVTNHILSTVHTFPSRFFLHSFIVSRGCHGRLSVATMGRSEPPFLYDRPSTYSFSGPTDPGFNPRAVTQASRIPASPRQQPKGPLVDFNRHPDSVCGIEVLTTHQLHLTNDHCSGDPCKRRSQHGSQ